MSKISKGTNDRPRDASIAQTGPGIPDDSSRPVDVADKEIDSVRKKLHGEHGAAESTKRERDNGREPADSGT